MTMDRKELLKSNVPTEIPIKAAVKRPFDVAFLMLPDEKLKAKLPKNNNESDDEEIEVGSNQDLRPPKYFTQRQQIFDDPKNFKNLDSTPEKSAFTKVNLRTSPGLSISPELTYQNSLSPSPPIRNYQSMISPSQLMFKTQHAYQAGFISENFTPHHHANIDPFLLKTPEQMHQPKLRPIYRPELTYNYQQLPNQEMRSPAAAILTSLLPPSLAALSLPAQNVCAKCNISFRMTSDLVYHMRSHHKNDSMDMGRRRREEKLKCPVCNESFRERHHLTRHMTAHQDKDEDGEEGSIKKKSV